MKSKLSFKSKRLENEICSIITTYHWVYQQTLLLIIEAMNRIISMSILEDFSKGVIEGNEGVVSKVR